MASSNPQLATGPLRQVRAHLVGSIEEIAERIGALGAAPRETRGGSMRGIVADLAACLVPHLQWEERTIHPLVDKYACEGPAAFSASMRYDHEIIYRWIDDLRGLADGDAVPFVRRADNLLGVVLAHFELEEHVLFPILDRSMSPAALEAHAGELRGASR